MDGGKVGRAFSKVMVDWSQGVIAGTANPVVTSWQVPPVESAGGSRSANVPSKPLPAGGIRLEVKGNPNERQNTMPKYVIERESPDAGKSSVVRPVRRSPTLVGRGSGRPKGSRKESNVPQ